MSQLRAVEAPPVRVPPHNLEAEESVLGACLLSRQAIEAVIETLRPGDFYKPSHQEMFALIVEMYGAGRPVDAVTFGEDARRRGIDGADRPYLFTLVSMVPTPGSAAHYARIVAELATLRRLLDAGQAVQEIAWSMPDDVAAAVDTAEGLVYGVADRRAWGEPEYVEALLGRNMDHIEAMHNHTPGAAGLSTGYADIDALTAGFEPSTLVTLAGRPGSGKSALSLDIARHVAAQGSPAVIFSLEMSKDQLVQRLLCSTADVDSQRVRHGQLSDADWPRLSLALERLAGTPLLIDDTAAISITEVRAKARRIAATAGRLGLIVVDYLQLMAPVRRSDNRVNEVSEITRSLKVLAQDLGVTVLALSQLSRNVEYRADKRPMLADLRESGSIEQDSDSVWLVYRDEMYDKASSDKGVAEIHVAKARSGPTGTVRLAFVERSTTFRSLAREP